MNENDIGLENSLKVSGLILVNLKRLPKLKKALLRASEAIIFILCSEQIGFGFRRELLGRNFISCGSQLALLQLITKNKTVEDKYKKIQLIK